MDEPGADGSGSDDLFATYRERKRKARLGAQASPDDPEPAAAPPATSTAPQTSPSAPSRAAAVPPPPSTRLVGPPPSSLEPAAPLRTATPSLAPIAPPALEITGSSLAVASPPSQLTATASALKLSEALLADKAITVRGSPAGRAVGVALFLLGLALLAYDRRSVFLLDEATTLAGVSIRFLAGGHVVVGGAAILFFSLVPTRRRLAVRLAESQADEWRRIQVQTKRLSVQIGFGLVAAILGLVTTAAAYTAVPVGMVTALAALGGMIAALGLGVMCFAAARRSLARRLYVQTLVLSGLERSGVGASDTRVAPVLLALDELLGALPADQVQKFLASPQAQAYLDLIDEAGRSHGK